MNRVILMGRLTKDPDSRFFQQSGTTKCNFILAVDRRFVRQGEERTADFFPVITFGKTAEFCGKYFQKGMQVLVSGRLQNRTWDDPQGVRHYVTEVVADEAYFADSKRSQQGQGQGQDGFADAGRNTGAGGWPSTAGPSPAGLSPTDTPFGRNTQAGPAGPAARSIPYAGQPSPGDKPGSSDKSAATSGQGGSVPADPEPQTGNDGNGDDGYYPMDDDDQLPF